MILSLILLADNLSQEIVVPAFFPAMQNNGQDGHRIGAGFLRGWSVGEATNTR
jgi:hypothetical protein